MQEESYVPIEIHLAYIDSVNSASPQKRAHATALLQRYPQLDAPTPPAHATYRTNTLPDVPEITFEDHYILPTLQESSISFLRQRNRSGGRDGFVMRSMILTFYTFGVKTTVVMC